MFNILCTVTWEWPFDGKMDSCQFSLAHFGKLSFPFDGPEQPFDGPSFFFGGVEQHFGGGEY